MLVLFETDDEDLVIRGGESHDELFDVTGKNIDGGETVEITDGGFEAVEVVVEVDASIVGVAISITVVVVAPS